jgi:hypothetical protein
MDVKRGYLRQATVIAGKTPRRSTGLYREKLWAWPQRRGGMDLIAGVDLTAGAAVKVAGSPARSSTPSPSPRRGKEWREKTRETTTID